jgi:hypothetical protein
VCLAPQLPVSLVLHLGVSRLFCNHCRSDQRVYPLHHIPFPPRGAADRLPQCHLKTTLTSEVVSLSTIRFSPENPNFPTQPPTSHSGDLILSVDEALLLCVASRSVIMNYPQDSPFRVNLHHSSNFPQIIIIILRCLHDVLAVPQYPTVRRPRLIEKDDPRSSDLSPFRRVLVRHIDGIQGHDELYQSL